MSITARLNMPQTDTPLSVVRELLMRVCMYGTTFTHLIAPECLILYFKCAYYFVLLPLYFFRCTDPKLESPCLTRERYRSHLQNCVGSLQSYLNPLQNTNDLALKTYHLKSAINNIGYITGHLGTEDILDIIFRDFCIGK